MNVVTVFSTASRTPNYGPVYVLKEAEADVSTRGRSPRARGTLLAVKGSHLRRSCRMNHDLLP